MQRREFLRGTVALGAAGLLPGIGLSASEAQTVGEIVDPPMNHAKATVEEAASKDYQAFMSADGKRLSISDYDGSVDDLLEQVADQTDIRFIGFHKCNNFTGEGFRHLTKLTQLERIHANGCPDFTGEGLRYLLGIADLKDIHYSFGSYSVTDSAVRAICQFTNLQRLQLCHCHAMTGERAFEGIGQLKDLELLSLCMCDNLRRLEFDGLVPSDDFTDYFPFEFHSCPNLEEIHFRNCSPLIYRCLPIGEHRGKGNFTSLRLVTIDGIEQPLGD